MPEHEQLGQMRTTLDEHSRVLARQTTILEGLQTGQADIQRLVSGNGKPGINERVRGIERWRGRVNKALLGVGGIAVTLATWWARHWIGKWGGTQ